MSTLVRSKARRGTAAAWTAANPVLAAGEFGWESDTNKLKIGDGATAWTALAYFNPGGGGGGGAAVVFEGAKLTKSTAQAIGPSVEVMLTFDGEVFDTSGFHDNVANNTRVTIPTTGYYLIGASVRVDALAVDKRATAFFRKNGAFFPESSYTRMTNSIAGESLSMPLTALVQLTAGDYIEVGVFHTDTVARNVPATASGTTFWVTRHPG